MNDEFPDIEPARSGDRFSLLQQSARASDFVDDVTRALPHALGPEKAVLSCLLQYPETHIGLALEHGLTAGHFYLPSHAALFGMLVELEESGQEIELVSLVQKLLDRGLLDRVGGPAALADLLTYASGGGGHFRQHSDQVKDKFILRSIIQNSNEAIAQAYDAPDEVAELLDATEAKFLAIRGTADTGREVSVKDTMRLVMEDIERAVRGDKSPAGVSTGYDDLDKLECHLKPGDMFVIAARPSMGKTSLMMNIVEKICVDGQLPTQVFSMEMTSKQLVHRLTCARAKFSIGQLSRGYDANKGDLQRIKRASMEIASAPLHINDQAGLTISQLRAIARRKHRECKLELIAIDYLQLMRSTSKQAKDSREREVAEISAGIKGLAKELHIPIILLAQLNRGPEQRTGKNLGRPRLSDLRESGSIEQDADMVGLLYRPCYYDTDEDAADDGRAEVILGKNRNGPTGTAHLTFIADLMRFENGAPRSEPDFFQPKTRSRTSDP